MKSLLISSLLLVTTNVFAMDFHCEATYNNNVIVSQDVTLSSNERNKAFAEVDEFVFYLSDNGKNVVELQTLHMYEPTRSYATALITSPGQFVQLSIWKRDYLLEVICKAK